jgi:tRNA(fMet)-specific endonuclease VapC
MILDTNALSALGNQEPEIIEYLLHSPEPALSFIAVAEYHSGLLGSMRPKAGFEMLASLKARFSLLHSDNATITHYAEIDHQLRNIGRPIPTNDIWIAALARQHQRPILSRDHHFDFVEGIQRIEW